MKPHINSKWLKRGLNILFKRFQAPFSQSSVLFKWPEWESISIWDHLLFNLFSLPHSLTLINITGVLETYSTLVDVSISTMDRPTDRPFCYGQIAWADGPSPSQSVRRAYWNSPLDLHGFTGSQGKLPPGHYTLILTISWLFYDNGYWYKP